MVIRSSKTGSRRANLTPGANADCSRVDNLTMTQPPQPSSDPGALRPVVFREFLYADVDRARSLLAQRVGGVPEEERVTGTTTRKFNIGVKNYLSYGQDGQNEQYEQRSLLDALFPGLEETLEVEGWLTDISDVTRDPSIDDPAILTNLIYPGSIVRLTADGQLFNSEYIAQVLGGTSIAIDGIMGFQPPTPLAPGKKASSKPPRPTRGVVDPARLEDLVEDFDPRLFGVEPMVLRNMIRIARGMFNKGLHLLFSTTGGVGWNATARLQEGRKYLDAEPDVLFSRYGTAPQEWTIVGTVGRFSTKPDPASMEKVNFLSPDGQSISRARFVNGLNSLMGLIGGQGITDTPEYPGFSIVPLAVYRLIPEAKTS